jgi:hypothetical protein
MLACNMKGDVHLLQAPCLFGESLFLGQDVLACRCGVCLLLCVYYCVCGVVDIVCVFWLCYIVCVCVCVCEAHLTCLWACSGIHNPSARTLQSPLTFHPYPAVLF